MLIDRSHLSWALFSGISLIAGTLLYVSYAVQSPSGPSGGSAIGLLFGVLGTLMMLFAGLLAARKSVRVRRLGSAQFWLKGHLWLGTLCIPFILFHAGFGWGGFLEQLLWYTLALVAGSGFFGLAVQQFLPRLLWNQTPLETFEAQTPYQCDRMTFISDQQISALCGAPLDVPPDHLRAHIVTLVRDYYDIVNGPGARGELNARKLQLLQQVSPPAVRDFFWAMAKYAKSEAKAIRFEGDFPELLAATYAGLKPQSTESGPASPSDSHGAEKSVTKHGHPPVSPRHGKAESEAMPAASVAGTVAKGPAAVQDSGTAKVSESAVPSVVPAAAPKLSPLELMKKKAEEKKAAGAGVAPENSESAPKTAPKSDVADAPQKAKLSPLEQMRLKAEEKKAAAQTVGAQAAPVSSGGAPGAELTTEKPAAAVDQPAAKLSPLEQMRLKAAEKKAAAQTGGAQAVPVSSEGTPGAELTTEKPVAAEDQPAAKLSPLEQMRLKAAEKKAAAQTGGAQAIPVGAEGTPGAELTTEKPVAAEDQPAAKLSPLEQMRLKAAEKKAAAETGGASAAPVATEEKPPAEAPTGKLSPLELMKKKAAEKSLQTDAANPVDPIAPNPAKVAQSPLDLLKRKSETAPQTTAAESKPAVTPKPAVAREQSPKPPAAAPVAPPVQAPTASEKQVLRAIYLDTIRPFLAEFRTRRVVLSSPLASTEAARRLFHEKESSLPTGLHPLLNELSQYCDIRRQIEQQRRVLRWMHWWLMVHVPASMVLIVFLVAHVIMALRVIPF